MEMFFAFSFPFSLSFKGAVTLSLSQLCCSIDLECYAAVSFLHLIWLGFVLKWVITLSPLQLCCSSSNCFSVLSYGVILAFVWSGFVSRWVITLSSSQLCCSIRNCFFVMCCGVILAFFDWDWSQYGALPFPGCSSVAQLQIVPIQYSAVMSLWCFHDWNTNYDSAMRAYCPWFWWPLWGSFAYCDYPFCVRGHGLYAWFVARI